MQFDEVLIYRDSHVRSADLHGVHASDVFFDFAIPRYLVVGNFDHRAFGKWHSAFLSDVGICRETRQRHHNPIAWWCWGICFGTNHVFRNKHFLNDGTSAVTQLRAYRFNPMLISLCCHIVPMAVAPSGSWQKASSGHEEQTRSARVQVIHAVSPNNFLARLCAHIAKSHSPRQRPTRLLFKNRTAAKKRLPLSLLNTQCQ